MKKLSIILMTMSLYLIATFFTSRFFVQHDLSFFLKNLVDLPNILMAQLPENKDYLSQEDYNDYVMLYNEIFAEVRDMDYEEEVDELLKSMVKDTQIDTSEITSKFKTIVNSHIQELQNYFIYDKELLFSINDLSNYDIHSDYNNRIRHIRLNLMPMYSMILVVLYACTSYVSLFIAVVLFAIGILLYRKYDRQPLLQSLYLTFTISGFSILCIDAILYFVSQKISYHIMRYIGSISLWNYAIILGIGLFYCSCAVICKYIGVKKQ